MDVLICNLSAGIMIILTLILRKIAIFRIPNSVFCVLWAMVGIRLMFPVSLRMSFSILNVYFYGWNKLAPIKRLQDETLYDDLMFQIETAGSYAEEHISTFLVLWLIGCTILAAHFISSYFGAWKDMGESKPLEDAEYLESCIAEQGFRRKILLRSKSGMLSPMTWGLLRPVIYFPSDFDREDKTLTRLVLLHECGHIRYFHSLLKLWNMCLICAYWYNPIVWIMFFKFERDLEISADRYALRHTEGDVRAVYARYVIAAMREAGRKFEKARQDRKKIMYFNMFYYCNKGKNKDKSEEMKEERVEAIMNFKKMGACAIAATLLIPMGMTTVFATTNTVLSEKETGRVLVDTKAVNIEIIDVERDFVEESQPVSLFVDWKDIESYIVDEGKERASYLYVQNYEYVTYGSFPLLRISITTEFEGHTYKGSLDRTDYIYNDATDKYTGFYTGKIYRQD